MPSPPVTLITFFLATNATLPSPHCFGVVSNDSTYAIDGAVLEGFPVHVGCIVDPAPNGTTVPFPIGGGGYKNITLPFGWDQYRLKPKPDEQYTPGPWDGYKVSPSPKPQHIPVSEEHQVVCNASTSVYLEGSGRSWRLEKATYCFSRGPPCAHYDANAATCGDGPDYIFFYGVAGIALLFLAFFIFFMGYKCVSSRMVLRRSERLDSAVEAAPGVYRAI